MPYYLILTIFAILPSLVWLFYYLQKDDHPEPKEIILCVFLTGAVFAIIGLLFQRSAISLLDPIKENLPSFIFFSLFFYRFIIVAFSEELLKYFAFFFAAKDHREVDEPIDYIIYMITAALGFAALENFLLLFSLNPEVPQIMKISVLRFVSATLLHAVASGIIGCFLVYSLYFNKKYLLFLGLIVGTALHGIYNLLAERMVDFYSAIILFSTLLLLFSILLFFIKKIKRMKNICLVK